MTFIPEELWATISKAVPILCIDFVPIAPDGKPGLILRNGPYGQVWCHLGGRMQYGESVEETIARHLATDLPGSIPSRMGMNPQPVGVFQWFPEGIHPEYPGRDERKHAVSLAYKVHLLDVGIPAHEALDITWLNPWDNLPEPMWPGSPDLVRTVLKA